MKSSCNKEDSDVKKKYVFFSDPDVIVQRAEASATTVQVNQDPEVQQQQGHYIKQVPEGKSADLPVQFDLNSLKNLLSYTSVQPYPFTFISAVKKKLALGSCTDASKKTSDLLPKTEVQPPLAILKSNTTQNLYQTVHKMDFMKPLKVPGLKITPKTLDFSAVDNSVSKETMPGKYETPSKEVIHDRGDRLGKNYERVPRKLDFSGSEGPSIISNEVVEPLKVPNISISSNLAKKKEHIRDNSREKENRSKRIKKDETFAKQDGTGHDFPARSKSPRHISRKDLGLNNGGCESAFSNTIKNDRLSMHMPRESDFTSGKTKAKNFATSTAKKDSEKKHKSIGIRSQKLTRDNSLESKNRSCSNESLSECSVQLPSKITTREPCRHSFENPEHRYKDDFQMLNLVEEQKHIVPPENRQLKQHKLGNQFQERLGNITFREQIKRGVSDKGKCSASKIDGKKYIVNSEESVDVDTVMESNSSIRTHSPCTTTSIQANYKDSEKPMQNIQYTDNSLSQCANANIKKNEESFTQSDSTTTKQTNTNNEQNDLHESTLSETLLDTSKISFRDENRSQQDEFYDLVTPDMNLVLRSKRKKQFLQNSKPETDAKVLKYTPVIKMDTNKESIQLLHPTALHKQFQAELLMLDSFNESLKQVWDVEKCLYNVKREQENELQLIHQAHANEKLKSHISETPKDRGVAEAEHCSEATKIYNPTIDAGAVTNESHSKKHHGNQANADEFDSNLVKINKPVVKAVEVQTQTVNDMATQTDIRSTRGNSQSRCPDIRGITYERGGGDSEIPELSLDSVEQFEDLDQIEEISLPSKLRTMSEISLHETTSSIRTETGTEISISTRDVTCYFNKYLDLEIEQLIKDEKQRYDRFEMLFKSRERALNDRTKKLVKLEEQKRALRDTGQDSRVSSVKKKQRALLLKLQQEKDEMNRLKELHKITSQERKVMLQKQRNMFNPQMSTKNILTKLKRSADSQSPRRLSGPMKGYDIRSNSSMSSLVDSDKSQQDRSQADMYLQISESDMHLSKIDIQKGDKFTNLIEESNRSLSRLDKSSETMHGDISQEKSFYQSQKEGTKSRYEIKSRSFEEKMPRADALRLKSHQFDVESKLIPPRSTNIPGQYLVEKDRSSDVSQLLQQNLSKSISEHGKSESDTLVEELLKKSKSSQATDSRYQSLASAKEKESISRSMAVNTETIKEEISLINQDTLSKTSRSSQVSEDILQSLSKNSRKSSKTISTEKDVSKKSQYNSESKLSSKRKSSKCQKSKSSSSILTENILRSKSNSLMSEEFLKHHNKRTKVDKEMGPVDKNDDTILDNVDFSESQGMVQTVVRQSRGVKDKNSKSLSDMINDIESKENVLCREILDGKSVQHLDNISTKSQVNAFAVSRHSSEESEKSYSKSVVVRSQSSDFKTSKKLEQILNAREATLASRKNCIEEWMAWHARLRAEEDRVTRMEQVALKLVTATSNAFSQQERSVCPFIDTTVSSDTSDVEGRIELLTEKLADRRMEMSRLKREARKQTKQRLRALEANLLNQIKKYDTTIHEMRKKLESKKGITKDSDNLAIESRSLADYKVPEIPLKRIQDIYKRSDLLRSRSESDLLSSKRQAKDIIKNINALRTENATEASDRSALQRSLHVSKSMHASEHLSSAKGGAINQSMQSIFDECILEQIEHDKIGSDSISSTSDEAHFNKRIPYESSLYRREERYKESTPTGVEKVITFPSQLTVSEDIKTEISAQKSEDILTALETRSSGSESYVQSEIADHGLNTNDSAKYSRAKNTPVVSEIVDLHESEYSQNFSAKLQKSARSTNTEIKTAASVSEDLDYSKKLDSLSLNNKNLNEDLSSLENELRALSEKISRINKIPNQTSEIILHNEERSTSKDISEIISKSDGKEQFNEIEIMKNDINKDTVTDSKRTASDISEYLSTSVKSTSFSDNDVAKDVDHAMSAIITENELSLPKSNQEMNYEARSKEILNEIEKSIISEHIKSAETDLNRSSTLSANSNMKSYNENNEFLNGLVSPNCNAEILSDISLYATSKNLIHSVLESMHISPREENLQEDLSSSNKLGDGQLLGHLKPSAHFDGTKVLPNEQSLNVDPDLRTDKKVSVELNSEVSNSYAISNEVPQVRGAEVLPVLEGTTEPLKVQTLQSVPISAVPAEIFRSSGSSEKDINEEKEPETAESFSEFKNSVDLHSTSRDYKEKPEHAIIKGTDRFIKKSNEARRVDESNQNILESTTSIIVDEHTKNDRVSLDKGDWTISDSFDIKENNSQWEELHSQKIRSYSDGSSHTFSEAKDVSEVTDNINIEDYEGNVASYIEDASMFIPRGESTNIEGYELKFDGTISDSHISKVTDDLQEILNIAAKDINEKQVEENVQSIDSDDFQKAIHDSVIKILDKVEKSIENDHTEEKVNFCLNLKGKKAIVSEDDRSVQNSPIMKQKLKDEIDLESGDTKSESSLNNNNKQVTKDVEEVDEVTDEDPLNISLHIEVEGDENIYCTSSKSREIIITELAPGSEEGEILPELEIDAKIELAEEESAEVNALVSKNDDAENYSVAQKKEKIQPIQIEIRPCLELITEQDSSDGEQLDNLVEVAESGLDTIEKKISSPADSIFESKSASESPTNVQESAILETQEQEITLGNEEDYKEQNSQKSDPKTGHLVIGVGDKTFEILKDPEYEDISEESLEVSEILDRSQFKKSSDFQKSSTVPEKYQVMQKSEEVLRILDEIAQKNSLDSETSLQKYQSSNNALSRQIKENIDAKVSNISEDINNEHLQNIEEDKKQLPEEGVWTEKTREEEISQKDQLRKDESPFQISNELPDFAKSRSVDLTIGKKIIEKQEQDTSSESSEADDTPRGVSEIEIDSPRDPNDSRLDLEVLNDDLLSDANAGDRTSDSKTNFPTTAIAAIYEKDLEVMIDKLKASLDQPGSEDPEFAAKLLSIEQLEIELKIKKLEAEAESYYVREIPNKPPPPYTPPGGGTRISTSLKSPSPPPAVIPSNIDELTAFTEKATAIIFKAKQAGEDIMSLEAPTEIYALAKETNETVKKDRRIYNTFVFDLCKEIIAEVYHEEYEKPGPSWTMPNVKTKPIMKIPKNVEELHEYVSKEVATLFGFKTKLQRENMVMRWSRKRRDRVDELLAREAQAEEDVWTKFHHDELAVKNDLTVAILDTLVMETVNIVKVAYAKKRKIMV